MPGLTGIIRVDGGGIGCATALEQMSSCMMHEPFYSSGKFVSEAAGLCVAWTAFEGSSSERQPIWNEGHDIATIVAGDFYQDSSDIEQLHHRGHDFDPQTLEWIVHLYEDKGLSFIEELNGSFTGVLIDLRDHQPNIVLFNDRYGLGRLYYHLKDGFFFFASEAKTLLKVLPELRKLDLLSLGEWLSCGCVLQNRTLFEGISLLPPGAAWQFRRDGAVTKRNYFDVRRWEAQPKLSQQEYFQRLLETFPGAVNRYFGTGEKIGMSLTGGLDGRMIMAWAPSRAVELPCYTFNSPYRDCADVLIARQVAQACGQTHQTITLNGSFFAGFPELAEQSISWSDGSMDVTGAAEIYVNRIARQLAPVRMTGNYGSEILRSHVAFRPGVVDEAVFDPAVKRSATEAVLTYQHERLGDTLSFIAFKQVPWHHYSRMAVERSQLNVRSPFLDNQLVALAFQAPTDTTLTSGNLLSLIARSDRPVLAEIPTDRGESYPNGMGTKLRRAWAEFWVRAEYAFDYGMPRWLARINQFTSPFGVDRMFLGRQKFCHFRTWYRKELAGYVKDMLLDSRTRSRPYLRGNRLEALVNAHISGSNNFTTTLHKLLSLELVHRLLLESPAEHQVNTYR